MTAAQTFLATNWPDPTSNEPSLHMVESWASNDDKSPLWRLDLIRMLHQVKNIISTGI